MDNVLDFQQHRLAQTFSRTVMPALRPLGFAFEHYRFAHEAVVVLHARTCLCLFLTHVPAAVRTRFPSLSACLQGESGTWRLSAGEWLVEAVRAYDAADSAEALLQHLRSGAGEESCIRSLKNILGLSSARSPLS